MDIDHTSCEQRDKMCMIEAEVSRIRFALIVLTAMMPHSFSHILQLKKQNPELFAVEDSKKRLFFATQLVMRLHSNHRLALRLRKKKSGSAVVPTPSRSSPIITRNPKRDRSNYMMPESVSQTLPQSNKSSVDIKPDTTYKQHDPNQYPDIHSFLKASAPPMTHLMDAFINFGCTNADYLLAISSWSSEAIADLLNQLSLGPAGRQLTEMDKLILQDHFKEYFDKLAKKKGSTDKSSDL